MNCEKYFYKKKVGTFYVYNTWQEKMTLLAKNFRFLSSHPVAEENKQSYFRIIFIYVISSKKFNVYIKLSLIESFIILQRKTLLGQIKLFSLLHKSFLQVTSFSIAKFWFKKAGYDSKGKLH